MTTTNNTLRILYVTPFWPHRSGIGSEVRSLNVLRALKQMGTVEVIVLADKGADIDPFVESAEFDVSYALEVGERRNEGLLRKLRWTVDPRSPFPNGCCVGEDATQRILRSQSEFDLTWFFKLRSPDMFPTQTWRRSVVDIDDVPSIYERTKMETADNSRDRLLALRRLFSWRRREKLLGERFSVLTVCSQEDKRYLERMNLKGRIRVIPNGFEKPPFEPTRQPATPPRVGFIGLLDYLPNREGIAWFVDECWARIKRNVPDARLRLIGAGGDGPLRPRGPDVDGLGWVANPQDEINTWSAMVVPIRIGAGTRVKIAQAFSQKCPVVSTSLGAYGYGAINGREMLLADTAKAFSQACIKTIREQKEATEMAERAWRLFLDQWTWDAICPLVWEAAEICLRSVGDLPGSVPSAGSVEHAEQS